jgi:hypothetical protein
MGTCTGVSEVPVVFIFGAAGKMYAINGIEGWHWGTEWIWEYTGLKQGIYNHFSLRSFHSCLCLLARWGNSLYTATSFSCFAQRNKTNVQPLPGLRSGYVLTDHVQKSNFVQVKILYICGQLCTYTQRSPPEIQAQTHWNLISPSMTAPPPVLSPSSILLPPLSYCAFVPTRKYSACISKTLLFQFLVHILKLCKSTTVLSQGVSLQ